MELDPDICEKARLARDPRFDGLFFTGVHSTGIFCRPICPAPPPKPEHIVYYPTAASAMEAGLRPCLRCRPEASPGTPAWNGTSATVSRAMRLIRQGALNECGVDRLAERLGVSGRHLRRLFKRHVGVSPLTLATFEKVLFAKKLLSETMLPVSGIAFAVGFGSLHRFNAAFKKVYGTTPTDLRRRVRDQPENGDSAVHCTLELSYRPPFDWQAMLDFFALRAIRGMECVTDGVYRRTFRMKHTVGILAVSPAPTGNVLRLRLRLSEYRELPEIVERVRRMFDLDANMAAILPALQGDPLLAPLVARRPGLRLPGGWDPFEVAVRAVVGQQISVKAACTVVGRIVAASGPMVPINGDEKLRRFFPTADELLAQPPLEAGLTGKRLATLLGLAEAVHTGKLDFTPAAVPDMIERLTALPGIGPWTAQYIAMRAMAEPDVIPVDDLGIVRALEQDGCKPSRKQILARTASWRPWRAYAAIHLWNR